MENGSGGGLRPACLSDDDHQGEKHGRGMTDNPLSAKAIRQAHAGVEQVQSKQYQLAALLHRIYYKSKAQQRGAKWFQSIGGMRKCFARLLDMKTVKSKIEDSLPDRGVAAKSRAQRQSREGDGRDHGSLDALQRALGTVWSSLWADRSEQNGSLIKYDTVPSNEADAASALLAAKQLLIVCLQLQELANRSRSTFNILQIHLRTPPAPTFAPLVFSLLTLCAQIHSACVQALWTDCDKTVGMARLYGVFRSAASDLKERPSLVLDSNGRLGRLAIEKTTNLLQSAGKNPLGWMPKEIIRATHQQAAPGQKDHTSMDIDPASVSNVALPPIAYADDEDLGEAV